MKVEIIEFRDEYAKYFTAINVAWVSKYFVMEEKDKEILYNPKNLIIDKGGFVYFAKAGDKIAGTFALIKIEDGVFELSKMGVEESFRGNNIGNKMLQFCIDEAKKLKINKIILYSNTLLGPAIHLYKKFGFIEVPLDQPEYQRADIKMEINVK